MIPLSEILTFLPFLLELGSALYGMFLLLDCLASLDEALKLVPLEPKLSGLPSSLAAGLRLKSF